MECREVEFTELPGTLAKLPGEEELDEAGAIVEKQRAGVGGGDKHALSN